MNRYARYEIGASQDIEEIFDYLDEQNEMVAERFYDAVETTVQQLLRSPNLGERCRFRNLATKGMRVWQVDGFSNYLIFYRPSGNGLQIL